ncbi:hypothetical protein V6N13_001737 [Hibiscus sabdariffa]|uniref:Uncharacterized protein n=1 Tax=Hibiscus sabdariffa TaxID=183260 RepID=A0ABR2G9X2_9ROSI
MENPNPNVGALQVQYENTSGRPSDGGTLPVWLSELHDDQGVVLGEDKSGPAVHFVFPLVLERPASSTPLESQRAIKKGRSDLFDVSSVLENNLVGAVGSWSRVGLPSEMMETEDQHVSLGLQGVAREELGVNNTASDAAVVQGKTAGREKH